jgi:hypothetical protein
MTVRADHQTGTYPTLTFSIVHRPQDAVHDAIDRNSSTSKALGTHEQLGPDDPVLMGPSQIGCGHVVEVRFMQEHAATLEIEIEERLQVREMVSGSERFRRFPTKLDTVPFSQCEHHLGLQAAFDVHVQVGFRHSPNESAHLRHEDSLFLWSLGE